MPDKKYITGYEIFNYWKDQQDFNGNYIIIDWGEKECFACRRFDYEIKKNESLKEFWNKKTHLQKAHILAKSLGGTYDPSNIVFLCRYCHLESPDFINRNMFLSWLTSKRKNTIMGFDYSRFEYELNNIIKGYNQNPKYEFMKLDKCLILKALIKGVKREEPLIDYLENNITYHPGEIPYSTYASALISYAIEQIEKDFFDHYKGF